MANTFGTTFACPQCGFAQEQGYPYAPGYFYGPGQLYGAGFGYGPGFGFGHAPNVFGYGLGGLRRWGGTYSPQYTATGLPTDEEIEEMVYDAIDDDPLIPWDADIEVRCEAGECTLTGEIPNKRIKHAAGNDAWWIPGVVDVHNTLVVTGRRRVRGAPPEEERREAREVRPAAPTRTAGSR